MRSEFSAADVDAVDLAGWRVSLPRHKDGDSVVSRIRRTCRRSWIPAVTMGPWRICGSAARAVAAALLTVTMAKQAGYPGGSGWVGKGRADEWPDPPP